MIGDLRPIAESQGFVLYQRVGWATLGRAKYFLTNADISDPDLKWPDESYIFKDFYTKWGAMFWLYRRGIKL